MSAIALLAHTNCGMVGVRHKRATFIRGLVERGGWEHAHDDRLLQLVPG